MLLLNRKTSQQILIGDEIVVTVSRISGKRVHLAILAPHDVRILRAELDAPPQPATPQPETRPDA